METIAVMYRVEGVDDDKFNVTFLSVPKGREVLLLDLLQVWIRDGFERICYTFLALVDAVPSPVPLKSPVSLLPIKDQMVRLLLVPSAAPPVTAIDETGEWLDYYRWLQENPEAAVSKEQVTRDNRGLQGENARRPKNWARDEPYSDRITRDQPIRAAERGVESSRIKQSNNQEQTDHASRQQDVPHRSHGKFSATSVPVDVTALADAASAATELTGQAARSLFNFAAKSIKTVAHNVASLTGHLQVGNHKVVVVKELAQGGFGIVFLVRDVQTNAMYAMKQMFCQSKEQMDEAHLELRTLQKFAGNPNIIQLLDHASVPATKAQHRQVLLLFPFYSAGTAWDMIADAVARLGDAGEGGLSARTGHQNWPFPEKAALITVLGVARGLRAMHDEGLAHRDMKPHNILISDTFQPVIMDMGSVGPARVQIRGRIQALKAEDEASVKCSAPYRAPEISQVANECDIDEKVDTWSLGCTMYCLAFGNSPFESPKEGVLKLAILNARYTIPVNNKNTSGFVYTDGFIALMQSMLALHARDRPGMEAIVQQCKVLLEHL